MASAEAPVEVEVLERALLDGVTGKDGARVRLDLGLVPVFSEERPLIGLAGLMDWRGCGRLSAIFRSGFASSSYGEQLLLPCDDRLPVARLVLVGLGSRAEFDEGRASEIARGLVGIARGLCADSVLLTLPCEGIERSQTEALFAALLRVLREPAPEAKGDTARENEALENMGGSARPGAPGSQRPRALWWVAAEQAMVARLRRVIAGPPRAARGTGLHT